MVEPGPAHKISDTPGDAELRYLPPYSPVMLSWRLMHEQIYRLFVGKI